MIDPAYYSERASRPWHRKGGPRQSMTDFLSGGDGADNLGRVRRLEFSEQSTREERVA